MTHADVFQLHPQKVRLGSGIATHPDPIYPFRRALNKSLGLVVGHVALLSHQFGCALLKLSALGLFNQARGGIGFGLKLGHVSILLTERLLTDRHILNIDRSRHSCPLPRPRVRARLAGAGCLSFTRRAL